MRSDLDDRTKKELVRQSTTRRSNVVVQHPRSSQSISQVAQQIKDDQEKRREMKQPTFKSKKAMLDLYLRSADPNLRVRKAIRHFKDAVYQRQARTDIDLLNNRVLLSIFEISIHPLWSLWIIFLTLLYVIEGTNLINNKIIVFFEPSNQEGEEENLTKTTYFVTQESVTLTFYLMDTFFSLFQRVLLDETWETKYLGKPKVFRDILKVLHGVNYVFVFKALFLTMFVIDEGLFFSNPHHTSLRFSRVLRPLWLIFHSKEVSHTLTAMVLSFSRVIDTFLFFILLCLFWAFLGYNMLSGGFSSLEFKNQQFYFQDYFTSFISLYTLLSMDSYPNIFLYIVKDSNWYLLYFLPFVMLNLFFLLTFPPAIIFLKYKEQMARLVLKDKIRVSEALVSCFICLDTNQSGTITFQELFTFMDQVYNHRALKANVQKLFNMIDIDADNLINMEEFLEICDLMEYLPRLYDNAPIIWAVFRQFVNQKFKIDKLAKSHAWNLFVLFVVLVNTVIVIYYFVENPSPEAADAIENLDNFFNAVYVFDVVIKIVGYGVEDYFAEPWYQFDFIMVVISITTIIGINYLYFLKKAKSGKLLKIVKVQKALRMVRAIRSIKFFQFMSYGAETVMRIKRLFVKVSICFPIVFRILLTLMYIAYVYAVIGIIIFNTQTQPYRKGSPYTQNDYTNFDTFMGALLALFQVLTQSGWTTFIYDYGYKFNNVSASIYFCSFHLFSVFFMFSLLMGLLWETFYVVDKAFSDEEEGEDEGHSHAGNQSNLSAKESAEKLEDIGGVDIQITGRKKRTSRRKFLSRLGLPPTPDDRLLKEQPYAEVFYEKGSPRLLKKETMGSLSSDQQQIVFTSASNQEKRKQKIFIKQVRAKFGDNSQEPIFLDEESKSCEDEDLYQWLKQAANYIQATFIPLERKNTEKDLMLKICELKKPTDQLQNQIEQLEDLKTHITVIGQYNRLKQADQEKKIQSRIQKKEKLKQTLTLNTQNALINQTYLKDYDKQKISQFEKNYLSSYYGQVCEIRDPMITYGPTLGLSNNIMMILRRVMRYNGLDLNYFAENLILVERLISAELLDRGSFIKLLFQFGENWYFIKRLTTDVKQFTIEMLTSDGIWDFGDIFNIEAEIFVNFNLWKDFDSIDDSAREIIMSTVDCFKVMSAQVSEYHETGTQKDIQQEVLCTTLSNNYVGQILQNFTNQQNQYRSSRNSAKAGLQTIAGMGAFFVSNIDHEFKPDDVPSKMFVVVARTEDKTPVDYDHMNRQQQTEKEKKDQDMIDINLKQLENNVEGALTKLPLTYIFEMMKDLRDIFLIYQFNLFQRVAELKLMSRVAQRIPEQEEEDGSNDSDLSIHT